jgi:hypothetical protein
MKVRNFSVRYFGQFKKFSEVSYSRHFGQLGKKIDLSFTVRCVKFPSEHFATPIETLTKKKMEETRIIS